MEGAAAERADRSDRARPRAQGGRHGVQRRHRRLAGGAARSMPSAPAAGSPVTGVYAYQYGPPPSFRLLLRSPTTCGSWRRRRGGRCGTTAVMVAILALGRGHRRVVDARRRRRKRQQYQAVLNERTRVARELHDTVEQGLAGITLQLEAVAGSLQTAPDAARQLAGRRAADVALQPRGDAPIGHGPAVAGAREPAISEVALTEPRAPDDARHAASRPTCA